MGYYTGNGVITSGGSAITTLMVGWDGGGYYNIENKTNTKVTTKNGMSYDNVKNLESTSTMTYHRFNGGLPIYNAKGTKTNVQWSRIGDSNLYVLNTSEQVISVRLNGGSWNS